MGALSLRPGTSRTAMPTSPGGPAMGGLTWIHSVDNDHAERSNETAGYSIAEAAGRLGLTADTLRYYERDGLLVETPGRAPSGHRRYTENDLGWILLITRLRATGMPIRTVRAYAELCRQGEGNELARLDLLYQHRDRVLAQLAQVTDHLGAINRKIGLEERDHRPRSVTGPSYATDGGSSILSTTYRASPARRGGRRSVPDARDPVTRLIRSRPRAAVAVDGPGPASGHRPGRRRRPAGGTYDRDPHVRPNRQRPGDLLDPGAPVGAGHPPEPGPADQAAEIPRTGGRATVAVPVQGQHRVRADLEIPVDAAGVVDAEERVARIRHGIDHAADQVPLSGVSPACLPRNGTMRGPSLRPPSATSGRLQPGSPHTRWSTWLVRSGVATSVPRPDGRSRLTGVDMWI